MKKRTVGSEERREYDMSLYSSWICSVCKAEWTGGIGWYCIREYPGEDWLKDRIIFLCPRGCGKTLPKEKREWHLQTTMKGCSGNENPTNNN